MPEEAKTTPRGRPRKAAEEDPVLATRVSAEVYDRIYRIAKAQGKSMSEVLRSIVVGHLRAPGSSAVH